MSTGTGSIVEVITTLPKPTRVLRAVEARRVAITAQQLAAPAPASRSTPVNRGHISRLVGAIGLLQIDSVNVLARSHLIPVFSRLGSYPISVLESLAWPARPAPRRQRGSIAGGAEERTERGAEQSGAVRQRGSIAGGAEERTERGAEQSGAVRQRGSIAGGAEERTERGADKSLANRGLLEAWAHEASLVPMSMQPLLRWRQEKQLTELHPRTRQLFSDHPGLVDRLQQLLADGGPLTAGQIERELETPGDGAGNWWGWSTAKIACEHLFGVGAIGVADRRGFERRYDLIERIVPPDVLAAPTPSEMDAKRALVAHAARAYGIGTVADFADYFRIRVTHTRTVLAELVEEGVVIPVSVPEWGEPAFLHRDTVVPRSIDGSSLVCPFDPLIWFRRRTERLFGMRFRIEIYTPAPKRVHGYYVLPLLAGDRLVGRFDLKADRALSRLLVQASWREPGEDPAAVARAAAPELRRMADWLALTDVVVRPRGDAHAALAPHFEMTSSDERVPSR